MACSTTQLVCLICQEQLVSNRNRGSAAALPCGHVFHKPCVDPWLHDNHSCPKCRRQVSSDETVDKLYFDRDDLRSDEEEDYDPAYTDRTHPPAWYERYGGEIAFAGGALIGAAVTAAAAWLFADKNKDKEQRKK